MWRSHASRFAVGRDWAAWENVTRWARLLPAPDADFAAEPLLVYEAHAFDGFWRTVERAWRGRPFVEALLDAMVSGGGLWKHCLRGDVYFLEVSFRAFLFHQQLYFHSPLFLFFAPHSLPKVQYHSPPPSPPPLSNHHLTK